MPEMIKIEFKSKESAISAMELKIYRGDELRNHGAPCSLIIHNGPLQNGAFWDAMRELTDSLNATPDSFPLRAPEVKKKDMAAAFSKAGRHVLAGGDSAYIDGIRRQDISMVACKALREMRAMGVITDDDYKAGLAKIEDFGLPTQESLFRDHRSFKARTEKKPSAPVLKH